MFVRHFSVTVSEGKFISVICFSTNFLQLSVKFSWIKPRNMWNKSNLFIKVAFKFSSSFTQRCLLLFIRILYVYNLIIFYLYFIFSFFFYCFIMYKICFYIYMHMAVYIICGFISTSLQVFKKENMIILTVFLICKIFSSLKAVHDKKKLIFHVIVFSGHWTKAFLINYAVQSFILMKLFFRYFF